MVICELWVYLVIPALLDGLPDTFGVFTAVIFVEIRGFDVGRGRGVRVVEETRNYFHQLLVGSVLGHLGHNVGLLEVFWGSGKSDGDACMTHL